MLLLLPAALAALQLGASPHAGRVSTRRSALAFIAGGPAALLSTSAAHAKFGEFAKMSGGQAQFAAGDEKNECMFAQPGTGICTVYKSSDPPLWASPNTELALSKLTKAAEQLQSLGSQVEGCKWSKIAQTLGISRDLREAVGFLTSAAKDPAATAIAKKVFQDLDGVQLAAQKKDAKTAMKYFNQYETDMAKLLSLLS
ncbi:hypothetical protein AB1Y20_000722 [Prymnesium parvum]|uniref:Uncharacterized protein n=1 Tax=Prymnesium parvum TaxID=97485 RepID=A0AB34K5L2_PRYPA